MVTILWATLYITSSLDHEGQKRTSTKSEGDIKFTDGCIRGRCYQ